MNWNEDPRSNAEGNGRTQAQAEDTGGRGATDIFDVAVALARPAEVSVVEAPAELIQRPPAPPAISNGDAAASHSRSQSMEPAKAPTPAPPAANVGFTQLLRALNFDQTKPKPEPAATVTPPAPPALEAKSPASSPGTPPQPATGGPMTQLLQMIDQPGQAATAMSQVTSFPPRAMPPAIPAAPAETVASPGPAPAQKPPVSFTQLFRTLDSPPAQEPPRPVAPPAEPAATQPSTATVPPAQPAASSAEVKTAPAAPPAPALGTPLSFTQLFRTLDAAIDEASSQPPVANPSKPAVPPAPVAAAPQKAPSPPPSAAAPPPSSFTEMFSQPLVSAPAPPAPAPPEPGSFTQMFQALGDHPAPAPPTGPPATTPAIAPASPAGSFTQMFSPPAAPAPREGSAPGSFTQMFQTVEAEPAAAAAPVVPFVPPPAQASGAAQPGSFTQMFSTSPAPAAEPPRADTWPLPPPPARPQPPAGFPQPAPPPGPSSASLTELLRTLDQTPRSSSHVLDPARLPATGRQAEFASGFTGLNPSGSGFPPAQPLPAPTLPPLQPPSPAPASSPASSTPPPCGRAPSAMWDQAPCRPMRPRHRRPRSRGRSPPRPCHRPLTCLRVRTYLPVPTSPASPTCRRSGFLTSP